MHSGEGCCAQQRTLHVPALVETALMTRAVMLEQAGTAAEPAKLDHQRTVHPG
jgi:hypothetical protein